MNTEQHYYVVGGNRLSGEVSIEGSKNSALSCIAAAGLADKDAIISLTNVPDISDVRVMIDLLRILGKTVIFENGTVSVFGELKYAELPRNLCGAIRGSTHLLGMMIGTLGRAFLGLPGGDKIGNRPIDIHLENLKRMGMEYEITGGVIKATAPSGLHACDLFLRFPSVGATCSIMLAASKIDGKTTISNCAKEPEIVDLARLLTKMGARIYGAGSDKISIYGNSVMSNSIEHEVISDRIETGVFLTAVAITGGDAVIKNCIPYHNYPLLSVLSQAGNSIETNDTEIHIRSNGNITPMHITTMPFPGVATDLQPLLTVLALKADGESFITDLVFPERFSYIYELQSMGARVEHSGNTIKVFGGKPLYGAEVVGNDIRAVTALICAGLIADGVSQVEGVKHITRGYNDFVPKLKALGAQIEIK